MEPGVSQAIKSFLAANGTSQPIRIDLNFRGCCDASLCLSVDRVLDNDLTVETEGLTFAISPETFALAGEVTVSYIDEAGKKGFVLRSSKPVSEWDGFGVCGIRT